MFKHALKGPQNLRWWHKPKQNVFEALVHQNQLNEIEMKQISQYFYEEKMMQATYFKTVGFGNNNLGKSLLKCDVRIYGYLDSLKKMLSCLGKDVES